MLPPEGEARVMKTFSCYLHKHGVMAPEVRTIKCGSEETLPDIILAEMRTWPRFEIIDVYDSRDEQVFRFTLAEQPLN
jgi:hypothetical protein